MAKDTETTKTLDEGVGDNTPQDIHEVMTENYQGGLFYDTDTKALDAGKLGDAYNGLLSSHLKKTDDLRAEIKAESLKGRPEEVSGYKFELKGATLPEGMTHQMEENDPTLEWFREIAHDRGLSNDDFNVVVNQYIGNQAKIHAESSGEYSKAEMNKLGERGNARIEAVAAWAKGALSEKSADALVGGIKDASGNIHVSAAVVEALEEVMNIGKSDMTLPRDIIPASMDRGEYMAETKAMMRTEEYRSGDKVMQAKVADRFKVLHPGTTPSDRSSGFRRQ